MRRVDPTVDIEADIGDDYMHLPVCDSSTYFFVYFVGISAIMFFGLFLGSFFLIGST